MVFFFNLMCILGSVQLFSTPGTVVCQAPLSVEFSRQEYWSGLLFPPLGDLPYPGIKPESPVAPALAGGFFITEPSGKLEIYLFNKFNVHKAILLITATL